MIKTKKGLSSLIVITMIIVVTVILATIFFAWLKESSKSQLDQTATELKEASNLSCNNSSFKIESFNIDEVNKNISFVLSNNSDLRLFNLVLSIHGKNKSAEDTSIVGRFESIVSPGEIIRLETDSNFTFITGNQETLNNLDYSNIEDITLTNGTCPKKIISIDRYNITLIQEDIVAEPNPGLFFESQDVVLSSEEGAVIYYTTNGIDPTMESTIYSSPINIPEDTNMTIKAMSIKEDYTNSYFSGVYTITHILDHPIIEPVAGIYYGTTDIVISAGEGATIYYGIEQWLSPCKTDREYTGVFYLRPDIGFKSVCAKSIKEGYGDSNVFTLAPYEIKDSNDNFIYSFNFKTYDINGTIDNDANTITAELPAGTDLTGLTPTITIHRDALISPRSEIMTDFTNPVIYTVKAGDITERPYIVTVTLAEGSNSVVYDESTKILTITLSPDIGLKNGAQIKVYDSKEVPFIQTEINKTTTEMDKYKPSPYSLNDGSQIAIGFDPAVFLSNYSKGEISHFDIVDGSSNVLATIPVKNITISGGK